MKLSTDLTSIESSTTTLLTAIGESVLRSNVHYWCCRIGKFPSNDEKACLEVGVVKGEGIENIQQG